jgi:hypothetical protein
VRRGGVRPGAGRERERESNKGLSVANFLKSYEIMEPTISFYLKS